MSNFKEEFESILKIKLQQKANSHTSEETLLMRYFKYFDLDNSSTVSKSEFIRAVEKIGVVVDENSQLEKLFDLYDSDHSGFLDYKEFSAALFGEDSRAAKQLYAKSSSISVNNQRADEILESLKVKISNRGTGGLLGLARLYSTQNATNLISYDSFFRGLKEYRIPVIDSDAEFIFKYFDNESSDTIDYVELLKNIRGSMTSVRKGIVEKAYQKLSEENENLTTSVIEQSFNAVGHPDVKKGSKTQDEIITNFITTFELHHSLYGKHGDPVSLSEFLEYYEYVSSVIENDLYFENLISGC